MNWQLNQNWGKEAKNKETKKKGEDEDEWWWHADNMLLCHWPKWGSTGVSWAHPAMTLNLPIISGEKEVIVCVCVCDVVCILMNQSGAAQTHGASSSVITSPDALFFFFFFTFLYLEAFPFFCRFLLLLFFHLIRESDVWFVTFSSSSSGDLWEDF